MKPLSIIFAGIAIVLLSIGGYKIETGDPFFGRQKGIQLLTLAAVCAGVAVLAHKKSDARRRRSHSRAGG
jgi:hypothetical protein